MWASFDHRFVCLSINGVGTIICVRVHFNHVHMVCTLFSRLVVRYHRIVRMWITRWTCEINRKLHTPKIRITTIKRDAMSSKPNRIEIWWTYWIQQYEKWKHNLRNVFFPLFCPIRRCHLKTYWESEKSSTNKHMIGWHIWLLTLRSSILTMVIICSILFLWFSGVFFHFLLRFGLFFFFTSLHVKLCWYSALNACVQSAESTYLNKVNSIYKKSDSKYTVGEYLQVKIHRSRRLPFFFIWLCSTSFGSKKNLCLKKKKTPNGAHTHSANRNKQRKTIKNWTHTCAEPRHTDKLHRIVVCNSYWNQCTMMIV